MKLYIPSDHEEYKKLKHYVIAYGGEMALGEEDAEYIIGGSGCNAVSTEWIFDCVKQKNIIKKY